MPAVALDQVSSTGGATGINIDDIGAGTFTAAGGTLSGHSGAELDVNNGSGNITYPGTIGNGSGLSAQITGRSGGAIALSGNINDTSDTGGGIDMSSNTGGTATFSGATKTLNTGASPAFSSTGSNPTITFSGGGLDIDTTSGAGFSATGGGTIVVGTGANPNTIDSTTGTALNVTNTTIGGSGLTFRSISANGAPSGIVLNTTASSGGLTVTGNSSGICGGQVTANTPGTPATVTAPNEADCTGGAIRNTTDNAVSLTNTRNVSLTRMLITNGPKNGIFGSSVTDFSLIGSSVTNFDSDHPTGTNESGIFFSNLFGTSAITNSTLSGTKGDNFRLESNSGTLTNLAVSGSTFGPNPVGTGANGFAVVAINAASVKVSITGSTFSGNQASGFLTSFANTTTYDVSIANSTFNGNNIGFDFGIGGATGKFSFTGNTLLNHRSNALNIITDALSTSTTKATGTVSGNTVGNGTAGSGSLQANGIAIDIRGGAQTAMTVSNNNVRNVALRSFIMESRLGSGRSDFTVTGNTAGPTEDIFAGEEGIRVTSRDSRTTCLNMSGNTSSGTQGVAAYIVRQANTAVFQLQGFAGTGTSAGTVESFLAGQNTALTSPAVTVQTAGNGTIVNYTAGTCLTSVP